LLSLFFERNQFLEPTLRTISTLIQRFKVKFKDKLNEDSAKYLEIIEDSSTKLNELLESIESNIRTVIDESNAKIKYADLPEINSSKNLLYQVFKI
jgi:Mg2+ and Co2+ transporter CorA